jgi:hypothetical protein
MEADKNTSAIHLADGEVRVSIEQCEECVIATLSNAAADLV